MPDKIILEAQADPGCIASDGKVFIEIDGIRKQLKRVKSIVIRADCEGVFEADLTLYAANLETEVVITRANADAILAVEYGRQLSFLTGPDANALSKLQGNLVEFGWPSDDPRRIALSKILAELARREGHPF